MVVYCDLNPLKINYTFQFLIHYFTHKNQDGLTLFIHDRFDIEVFQSFQSVQKLSSILVNFAKLEYLVPNLTFTSKSAEVLFSHILRIQDAFTSI